MHCVNMTVDVVIRTKQEESCATSSYCLVRVSPINKIKVSTHRGSSSRYQNEKALLPNRPAHGSRSPRNTHTILWCGLVITMLGANCKTRFALVCNSTKRSFAKEMPLPKRLDPVPEQDVVDIGFRLDLRNYF